MDRIDSKYVGWFVGEKNNKVEVVSFIYNNDKTKIKTLNQNQIYDISNEKTEDVLSKNLGLKTIKLNDIESLREYTYIRKDGFKEERFDLPTEMSKFKINSIRIELEILHQRAFNKNLKQIAKSSTLDLNF